MALVTVACMTAAELVGNTHLKWFADKGAHLNLIVGIIAYAVVIYFLIKSFKAKSLMWTCMMWEAMIVIGGAFTAYFIFGEQFTHKIQYLGILLALGAAICINYDCRGH